MERRKNSLSLDRRRNSLPVILLKALATALVALLVYQVKQVNNRIDRLEKNQAKIMVWLGIEPVAAVDTLENGVQNPSFSTSGINQTFQNTPKKTFHTLDFFVDMPWLSAQDDR